MAKFNVGDEVIYLPYPNWYKMIVHAVELDWLMVDIWATEKCPHAEAGTHYGIQRHDINQFALKKQLSPEEREARVRQQVLDRGAALGFNGLSSAFICSAFASDVAAGDG